MHPLIAGGALHVASALAILLSAQAASPALPARVIMLSVRGAPVRPALLETLRIQLAGSARVQAGPELASAAAADRVAEASELARHTDADLTVWIEVVASSVPGRTEFIVFATPRTGANRPLLRALVEVGDVTATDELAVDRALGLKVGDLVDDVLSSAAAARAAGAELKLGRDTASADGPRIDQRASDPAAQTSLRLEAGLVGALEAGTGIPVGGALVAAGVRRATASGWDGELAASVHLASATEVADNRGRIVAREAAAALGLDLLAPGKRVRAGGFARVGVRRVDAQAVAPDGQPGSVLRMLPMFAAGFEARVVLGRPLELRLAAGAEGTPRPYTLAIWGVPLAAYGRVRPLAELSVVFTVL